MTEINEAAADPKPATSRVRGWIYANAYVVCIGVLSIVYAIAEQSGAHVLAFIVLSMFFAGVVLVGLTGRTAALGAIATAPLTWAIGTAHLGMEAAYFSMLDTLSPTEAALMVRLSVPISLVFAALALARWPQRRAWIGAAVITSGVIAMALGFDLATQWPGVVFGILAGFVVNLRAFSSEFHPHNRAAITVVDKLRVTGVVTLVTATGFLVAIAGAIMLRSAGVLPPLGLPTIDDFIDPTTVFLALLVGAALFTAMTYLQFAATLAIGTEKFLATMVLIPVAVALFQFASQAVGLIEAPAFSSELLPIFLIVIIGTFLVVSTRPS